MRLVDDDRVVFAEQPVAVDLVEQDAVGHQLDAGVLADPVGESHLIPHDPAEFVAELVCDAFGDGAGRDAPGLRVPDAAASELQQDLRQLRGLARPRGARHDEHLVVADRRGDVVAPLADRQLRGVADRVILGWGHVGERWIG